MTKSALTTWSWRILPALAGLVLLTGLIWWTSPAELGLRIREIGSGLAVLILLGGVSHLVKTVAWRCAFSARYRGLSLVRLFLVRLAGEAVTHLTFAGQLMAETTRAWMMRSAVSTAGSVSSVIADRAMFTIASLFVALVGLVLWVAAPGSGPVTGAGVLWLLPVLAAPVVGWFLALRYRWPFVSGPMRSMARVWPRLESRLPVALEIEQNVHSLYHDNRRNFGGILALQMVAQSLSVLEVYLVLVFLGVEADLLLALKIEAVVKCINLLGVIIPGNLGTSEAGNMLVLASLGLGSANGLALAVARRLRGWFWTLIGLVILYVRTFVFDPVAAPGPVREGAGPGPSKGSR